MSGDLADRLSAALGAALRDELGEVRVEALTRLSGGASRETWAFDAVDPEGVRHELILRRDPPGRPSGPGGMGREARSLAAAGAAGLPVPRVLRATDGTDLWGAAGLVMTRVAGETLARRILRDAPYSVARRALVGQIAQFLAGLHAIDPAAVGGLDARDPIAGLRAELDAVRLASPVFEWALRVLVDTRPTPRAPVLVHGDLRLGNLVVGRDGLCAVLDWELVHAGDPIEDLGWFAVKAWSFGVDLPVAGLGTEAELLAAYAAAGGVEASIDELRWWRLLGTLRWGALCGWQAAAHLSGRQRSVELAAIGRRVCEQEWDLLLLLDPDAAVRARARRVEPAAVGADRYGRPTAVELLDAAQEYLRDEAVPALAGATAFHGRVAANVLAIVARELAAAPAARERRAAELASLGMRSEAELAAAIRDGQVDGAQVVDVLAHGVVERLAVANPAYFDPRPPAQ